MNKYKEKEKEKDNNNNNNKKIKEKNKENIKDNLKEKNNSNLDLPEFEEEYKIKIEKEKEKEESKIGTKLKINSGISENTLRETFEKSQIINQQEKSKSNTYDGFDLSGTNQSMYKLFNIPAACEIEEYNFLFIDLNDFLNFHLAGLHLIELAEFLKKIVLSNKTPKIVINFPNILFNINIINIEIIEIILSIMSFTDIFLYDKKECLAFFNMLSQMNNERELNDKNLFEHFSKEILHLKTGVNKLGLFLENMQNFYIVENKGQKIVNQNDFFMKLYPQINHTNQRVIDEYKKILILNNTYFKSIFFGGFFSKFIFNEDNHSAFFSGLESVKRILELFKNKIDFPIHQEFYIIKQPKINSNKNAEFEFLKKKEEQFKLDCVNKQNSSIKYYNPLFDKNLNAFFSSHVIRKQLKEKNLIDTKGYVLYDSSYKNIAAPRNIKKRLDTAEKEKHLMHAIRNNRVFIL
jgi:hypothetical protein